MSRRVVGLAIATMLIGLRAVTAGGQPPAASNPARDAREPDHEHEDHAADPSSGGHDHAPAAPRAHGTPAGWRFTLPPGDAVRGRDVFVKLECYTCHEVKGQSFPGGTTGPGPELSEMAAHHEPEYFAESVMNPSAVVDEPRWRGADGKSRMPSFNEVMTVQELLDLVAYLKALTPPPGATGQHRH